MDDGLVPLAGDEARLQNADDTVRRTKEIVSFSKQEIEGMKKTISYTQEAIARTRKLLEDQQS